MSVGLYSSLCLVRSIDEVEHLIAMLVDGFGSLSFFLSSSVYPTGPHTSLCRFVAFLVAWVDPQQVSGRSQSHFV